MLNWGWYQDVNTKVVFLHLLLTANFKDTEWQGISVKRGDVVTSLSHLANELNLSVQNVRTALNHLRSTGEITSRSHSKFTIISILKYNEYQADSTTDNNEPTNSQQTDNFQTASDQQQRKNDNNDNNNNNDNDNDNDNNYNNDNDNNYNNDNNDNNYNNDNNDNNQNNDNNDNNYNKEKNVLEDRSRKVLNSYNTYCLSFKREYWLNKTAVRYLSVIELMYPSFNYDRYFQRVEDSDFLSGRNGRWIIGKCASLDWLLNPANLKKVVNGQYDNK